jgi:hypothetical protein
MLKDGVVFSVRTIPWIPPDGKYAGSCVFYENQVRIKIPYLSSDRNTQDPALFMKVGDRTHQSQCILSRMMRGNRWL